MKMDTVIAAGSLFVSMLLGGYQLRRWMQDGESKRKQQILTQAHSDVDRDSIIVGSAEKAVQVLEQTLQRVNNESIALRAQLAQTQAQLAEAQAAIATLRSELQALKEAR